MKESDKSCIEGSESIWIAKGLMSVQNNLNKTFEKSELGVGISHIDINSLNTYLYENELKHIDKYSQLKRKNEAFTGISLIKSLICNNYHLDFKQVQMNWSANGAPSASIYPKGLKSTMVPVSISHSIGYVVGICIKKTMEFKTNSIKIGVDIEKIPNHLPTHIISRYSNEERLYISYLPSYLRRLAFTKLWTRKESFVKASGESISKILHLNFLDKNKIHRNYCDIYTYYANEIESIISITLIRI